MTDSKAKDAFFSLTLQRTGDNLQPNTLLAWFKRQAGNFRHEELRIAQAQALGDEGSLRIIINELQMLTARLNVMHVKTEIKENNQR